MSLISSFAWNSSETSSLARKSTENHAFLRFLHLQGILRFLDPPYLGPFGQLGNIRLKMEEFASQVGGGVTSAKIGGGGGCPAQFSLF